MFAVHIWHLETRNDHSPRNVDKYKSSLNLKYIHCCPDNLAYLCFSDRDIEISLSGYLCGIVITYRFHNIGSKNHDTVQTHLYGGS